MRAKDLAKIALTSTFDTLQMFLGDLSDKDLTIRAVPSANNIAWQLAHLATAEKMPRRPGLEIRREDDLFLDTRDDEDDAQYQVIQA